MRIGSGNGISLVQEIFRKENSTFRRLGFETRKRDWPDGASGKNLHVFGIPNRLPRGERVPLSASASVSARMCVYTSAFVLRVCLRACASASVSASVCANYACACVCACHRACASMSARARPSRPSIHLRVFTIVCACVCASTRDRQRLRTRSRFDYTCVSVTTRGHQSPHNYHRTLRKVKRMATASSSKSLPIDMLSEVRM